MSKGIEKEIRFAVVMYGGVSLAIYMNGIAQELLTLVRSTSRNAEDLAPVSATEAVYRDIASALSAGPDGAQDGCPVRFVVDVLSGTSAGGINAVCLGKALTRGCPSLASLEGIWLNEGDIGKLLNDEGSEPERYRTDEPKTSLLNSQRMYGLLIRAFRDMEAQATGRPLVDQMDLYVTATDLRGINAPIRLNDGMVDERLHKHVFHFAYRKDSRDASQGGDFGRKEDPMLAFASRCTSSFPAAFEPMKLDRIRTFLGPGEGGLLDSGFKRWRESFFTQFTEDDGKLRERLFADGGYLDNRPFGHAVKAVRGRYATRPVERKLLFIDPFPEIRQAEEGCEEIDFIENIALAAMALPRYETIRGDIEEIKRHNAWVYRVDYLTRRIDRQIAERARQIGSSPHRPERSLPGFAEVGLEEAQRVFGDGYAAYHYAKVYAISDELTFAVVRAAGLEERSDLVFALRRLVKAWRDAGYRSNLLDAQEARVETENLFLLRFDLGYRIRRLNYLRQQIEASMDPLGFGDGAPLLLQAPDGAHHALNEAERLWLAEVHDAVGASLDSLFGLRRRLCAKGEKNPIFQAVQELLADDLAGFRAKLEAILDEPDRERANRLGEELFKAHADQFTAIADLISRVIREGFDDQGKKVKGTLEVNEAISAAIRRQAPPRSPLPERLENLYRYGYDLRESMRYPLLGGEDDGEGSEIAVFRISPIDAVNLWNRETQAAKTKLAGVALGAFGGFLDRGWRKNDILWGRLDGAERIICALMPGTAWRDKRREVIDRAHRAILEEYLGAWRAELDPERHWNPQASQLWAMLEELLGALRGPDWKERFRVLYRVDEDLDRRSMLERAGRASGILASMFDRLRLTRGRRGGAAIAQITKLLTRLGKLLLAVVDVSVPQSWASLILRQWFKVLGVLAAFLIGLALLLPPFSELLGPGLLLFVLVLAGWGLQNLATRFAQRKGVPRWARHALRALVALVVAGLLIAAATVIFNPGGFAEALRQLIDTFVTSLQAMLAHLIP